MKLKFPNGASAELVTEVVAAAMANAGTPCGDSFIDPAKECRKVGVGYVPQRFKLSKPVAGPTGAKIVGYEWRSKMGTKWSNYRQEDVEARVSDWDRADESTGTGRQIVHVFHVEHPDGTVKPEGIVSAQKVLGIHESRLMTIAKKERAAQAYRAEQDEAEKKSIESRAVATPQEAAQQYRRQNYSSFFTFEQNNESFYKSNLWHKDGKYVRRHDKADEQMTGYGWKKVEPDPAKEARQALQKPNEFTEELHPRDGHGRFAAAGSGTESAAFKEWFGKSKVVDAEGKPLRLYHGTKNPPKEFKESRLGASSNTFGTWQTERLGIFLTEDASVASDFAEQGESKIGAAIMPVYAKAENPIDLSKGLSDAQFNTLEKSKGFAFARYIDRHAGTSNAWKLFDKDSEADDPKLVVDAFKDMGFDSAVIAEPDKDRGDATKTWVLFDPHQIKSVFNKGTWSKTDKDIGNDGGVPCGDSYISSDKVCRVGEGAPRTETKAFKDWFGDSQVKGEDGKPLIVYHGTRAQDFDAFRTEPEREWTTLDRALGSHFAEQRSVPDAFTAGEYAYASDYNISDDPDSSWYRDDKGQIQYGTGIPVVVKRGDDGRYFPVEPFNKEKHGSSWFGAKKLGDDYALIMLVPNGRTIPVYLSIQKPLVVEPQGHEFDQNAISKAAQRLVFPHNKDLFVEATSRNTGMKTEIVSKMWDDFKAGKPGRDGKREWKDMNTFVDDYGTGLTDSHAAVVKRELEKLGYDGVKYKNTSANEVHGGNKWTWIAFRPEQIKSVFNKGTWSKTDKNMSNEPHPRLIGNSAEWEEAEHPRDEAGKFADKGSYGDLVGKKIYLDMHGNGPDEATVTSVHEKDGEIAVGFLHPKTGKEYANPHNFYSEDEYKSASQAGAFLTYRKDLWWRKEEAIKVFADPFTDWVGTSTREDYKREISKEIEQATGINAESASEAVHIWAESSNDTILSALTIQAQAAKITGGSMTDWQATKLKSLQETKERTLEKLSEGVHESAEDETIKSVALPFETFEKETDDEDEQYGTYKVKRTTQHEPLEATELFLQHVHDRTQEALAHSGIESLTLYRGLRAPLEAMEAMKLKEGDKINLEMNSLSSWSANKGTAYSFAVNADESVGKRILLKVTVPRKQVFSTAATGFGCLAEKEFVLHNGGLKDRLLQCEVIRIVK